MSKQWELDIRDNNFEEIDAVNRVVACQRALFKSFNALTLRDDDTSNLRRVLQRDRYYLKRSFAVRHILRT